MSKLELPSDIDLGTPDGIAALNEVLRSMPSGGTAATDKGGRGARAPLYTLALPPAPDFDVDLSPLDTAAARISALTLAGGSGADAVTTVTFQCWYVDEHDGPLTTLAADIAADAESLELTDATGFADGDILLLDGEFLVVGTPTGAVFPITAHGMLSSSADVHYASTCTVLKASKQIATCNFAPGFFRTDDARAWSADIYLPELKLGAVAAQASNAGGNSPWHIVSLTGSAEHGLRLTSPSVPGGTATVFSKTDEDFTLPAGWNSIYVLASSRDCTITMPATAVSEGVPETVTRMAGSAYDVIVAPATGDKLNGSATPYHLTQDGESRTWVGGKVADRNWIETSSAGESITPPPAAAAPNVTTATCVPYYTDSQGGAETATGRLSGYKGVITLPDVSTPHFDELKRIEVYGTPADGKERILDTKNAPWADNTVDWRTYAWERPGANTTLSNVRFVCFNSDGTATPDPFTIASVAVVGQPNPPSLPDSVACTENPAERWRDDVNLPHAVLRPTATLPANSRAMWMIWWLSKDGGATWTLLGKNWLSETARYDTLAPAAGQTWKIKGASGNYWGENSIDAGRTADFSVDGLSPVATTGPTSVRSASASYTLDDIAFYPTIAATNPTDVNFFTSQITVQLVNAAGSPAPWYEGVERNVVQIARPGAWSITDTFGWTKPKPTEPADGYRYFRLRIRALTRADQSSLQHCWAGDADHYDLYVSESQQIDIATVDPSSLRNLTVEGGLLQPTTDNGSNLAANPQFEYQGATAAEAAGWGMGAYSGGTVQRISAGLPAGVLGKACIEIIPPYDASGAWLAQPATLAGYTGPKYFTCQPGDIVTLRVRAKGSADFNGQMSAIIRFVDTTYLTDPAHGGSSDAPWDTRNASEITDWTWFESSCIVPNTVSSGQVPSYFWLYAAWVTGATAGKVWVDSVILERAPAKVNLRVSTGFEGTEFGVDTGTGLFTQTGLNLTKAIVGSYKGSEFEVVYDAAEARTVMRVKALSAAKINTDILSVGGNGQVSKFAVFNKSGNAPIGWIGDDSGEWIRNVASISAAGYVTLTAPAPVLPAIDDWLIVDATADNNGDGYPDSDGTYPVAAVYDASHFTLGNWPGTSTGAVGVVAKGSGAVGAWFWMCRFGGKNPFDAKAIVDSNGNLLILDATFQLKRRETNTNPGTTYVWYTAKIDTAFTIPAGGGSGTPAGTTNFTGLSISRDASANHRAAFINRGVICFNPNNYRVAAMVSYNGDGYGGDSGSFWGESWVADAYGNIKARMEGSAGGVYGAFHGMTIWPTYRQGLNGVYVIPTSWGSYYVGIASGCVYAMQLGSQPAFP